jgi:hypothetical protein
MIALALKSTVTIAIANVTVFIVSVYLLKRSSPRMQLDAFLALLLANATTLISLLSVNKEMIDLLVISLFCFSRSTHRRLPMIVSLIIAIVNRYEVGVMLLLFLFIQSRANPLKNRRSLTLCAIVVMLTLLLPILAMESLSTRFVEVQELGHAGVLEFLDNLEMHFLFFVAIIPKLGEVMFGELLNLPSRWATYTLQDAANSYILVLNNLANVLVLTVLFWKGAFRIKNDWIYLATICAIVVSISVVTQPRYFYLCYVLLCVQAAQPISSSIALAELGQTA